MFIKLFDDYCNFWKRRCKMVSVFRSCFDFYIVFQLCLRLGHWKLKVGINSNSVPPCMHKLNLPQEIKMID